MKIVRSLFLLILLGNAPARSKRAEGNFDKGWLFGCYGLQADGSGLDEPRHAGYAGKTSLEENRLVYDERYWFVSNGWWLFLSPGM